MINCNMLICIKTENCFKEQIWDRCKKCTRTWPVNLRQISQLLVHSLYICGKQFTRNVSVSYLVCYNSCTFQQHITGKLMSKTCLMNFFSVRWRYIIQYHCMFLSFFFPLCIHVSERPFKVPKLQHCRLELNESLLLCLLQDVVARGRAGPLR